MKRFLWPAVGCFAAALIAAPAAQAQTVAPKPPFVNPYAPAAPSPLRIIPGIEIPVAPPAPSIDPMPRMAPMPGIAPIPNLAASPFQRPVQPMAPMPGTGGEFPGATCRVVPRVAPAPTLKDFLAPGTELRQGIVPGTELRQYRLVPPAPSTTPRPDSMIVDGDFLYILRGDTLIKVDKKTRKVLDSTTLPLVSAPTLPNTLSVPGLRKWSDSGGNHSSGTHFGIGPQF